MTGALFALCVYGDFYPAACVACEFDYVCLIDDLS